ncbi:hypothetical protein SCHPADRAFT_942793 [Schizopora paradoxa]|uniref:Uncharacterized protein n=1 Tax=Schizopora paradoxa TaxID=27342 RepID=A0A0H2RF90_9AGAM|nr:hypothetical protein SCHPADRAFT_942793 [Schizopora paradoxa]
MDQDDSNVPNSNPISQGLHEGASGLDSAKFPDDPLAPSSFLDSLLRDDVTFSYTSTLSSNYTMSNIVGAGRVLGNLYSKAGLSLEKGLGTLAVRAGVGDYAKFVSNAIGEMFESDDQKRHEKACKILLRFARSHDAAIQLRAFQEIEQVFVEFPAKANSSFRNVFQRGNEMIDTIIFSWKRTTVEYSVEWLCHYKLSSRCLSRSNSLIDATAQLDPLTKKSVRFSRFEGLFQSCTDDIDWLLALRIICWYWDQTGVIDYVRTKRVDDLALKTFAIGLNIYWEAYFFELRSGHETRFWTPLVMALSRLSIDFICGITQCLRIMDTSGSYCLLQNGARLTIWVDIFKVHHFVRSSLYYSERDEENNIPSNRWRELCYRFIPEPICQKLLLLEDVHGPALRKRITPEKGSKISREEETRASSMDEGISDMLSLYDPREHEKACDKLLARAKSDDITVQCEAMEKIVKCLVKYPSRVHSAFRRVFEQHSEISDATTISWKRPGVDYSVKWLYWYKLASFCLSPRQSSFFEAVVQFDDVKRRSLDLSHFDRLLLSCG